MEVPKPRLHGPHHFQKWIQMDYFALSFFHSITHLFISTMSVTTTANPITHTIQSTLQDYDIHVTGHIDNTNETNDDVTLSSSAAVQNPSRWPRDHHRIPNYRPINRHLNLAERPNGSNGIEHTFLLFMFTGVALNAVSSTRIYNLWKVQVICHKHRADQR
jgi:hypothetical protein